MHRSLVAGLLMLTLSGTGAFAQALTAHQPSASTSTVRTREVHVHASDAHKCCPSRPAPRLEVVRPLTPANMPCGSEHDCCVRPGPANFAEVPSISGQQRPDAHQAAVAPGHSDETNSRPTVTTFGRGRVLPYGVFSTVLRT
jgi:hypothetical protein